ILNEWLGRGGVVVLGYAGDGEGYLDRWIANRWLESLGAGLAIGDRVLEDTATRRPAVALAQPWAEARRVGDEPLGSAFDPFPLDRNHVILARDRGAVLATASRQAFVRTPTGPATRAARRGHRHAAARPAGRPRTPPRLARLAAGPADAMEPAARVS